MLKFLDSKQFETVKTFLEKTRSNARGILLALGFSEGEARDLIEQENRSIANYVTLANELLELDMELLIDITKSANIKTKRLAETAISLSRFAVEPSATFDKWLALELSTECDEEVEDKIMKLMLKED